MARWYEAANEASFKPIAGGYVFQCPSPWVFAFPTYYRVSEAQKAAIVPLLGRWRLLLLAALLIIFVLMGAFIAFVTLDPGTFFRLVRPVVQYGTGVFTALLAVVMFLLMAPLFAIPQIYLSRALREPLAQAERTSERIRMGEQLPKIAATVSGKLLWTGLVGGLLVMGGAVVSLLAAYLDGELTRSLLLALLPLLILGMLLSAYFTHLVRLRGKLKRSAA